MLRPPRILSFDTSAAHCAAALLCDGEVVAEDLELIQRGQAERLMPMLERLLSGCALGWADLDAIAVGTGPGNFTGIRISVAAARGLSLALEKPAIGVSMFEVMSALPPVNPHEYELVSLEAPRGSAYVLPMSRGRPDGEPRQISPDAPPAELARPGLHVTGHAAGTIAAQLDATASEAAIREVAPRIARRAAFRIAEDGARISAPVPLYVRAADAAPPRDAPPVIVP